MLVKRLFHEFGVFDWLCMILDCRECFSDCELEFRSAPITSTNPGPPSTTKYDEGNEWNLKQLLYQREQELVKKNGASNKAGSMILF